MTATKLPLLLAVLLMQAVAEEALVPLLDFAGPEAAEKWQAVNDGVMGGVSDGQFRITPDNTLAFFGTLSTLPTITAADLQGGGLSVAASAAVISERDRLRTYFLGQAG